MPSSRTEPSRTRLDRRTVFTVAPLRALLLISFAAALAGFASSAHAAIPTSERDALIALYNSTNGPGWVDGTNWLGAPGTECTWHGVSCDQGETHVQSINLIDNNLVGTLPTSIANLTELQILDLPGNHLSGELPSSIWTVPELFHLNLMYSSVTGALDPQPSMLTLLLGGNSLTGNLDAICDCPGIIDVNLESNQITGPIPSCVGNLSGLFSLIVRDNSLTGTLPPGLTDLSELLRLALDGNQLTGNIPPEYGNFSKLELLDLKHNQLSGNIPSSLGNLTHLQSLVLGWNPITGNIPPELGNLASLFELILYSNQLSGTIPPELGNLSSLEFLELTDNQLDGQLPPEMSKLQELRHFDTSRNQLTGSIPTSYGSLSKLDHLILHSNQLSGNIPSSLGNLTNLQVLSLGTNALDGSIPAELGNLTNLRTLGLAMNQLSGSIPSQIGNLSALEDLWIDNNQLSGPLPPEIGDLSSLRHLWAHFNQLQGPLPSEIGGLSSIEHLGLSQNRFSGPIPAELGNLSSLRLLWLDVNALAGEIPSSFANLSSLNQDALRLGFNALYASDATLTSFINSVHEGEPFEETQTVAPSDLTIAATTASSVTLQWTPIRYESNPGAYRIYASTSSAGPFTLMATTGDKSASNATVSGLSSQTTYYFRVETVTEPHGEQQNTVVSEPSPVVVATPGVSEPDVAILSQPGVMSAYADGVSTDSTTFTLANFGEVATTVSLVSSGSFYTISSVALDLVPGGTSTVTLASLPQTVANDYRDSILLQGSGVPANSIVNVVLFAAPSSPTGSPDVEVETTRIDVSASKDTNPSGSVAFRNTGTGTATGILGADQSWIVPELSILSIEPGETRTSTFQIDRSRRPDADSLSGSQSGTLSFVYVAGGSAGTSRRNPLDGAPTLVTPVGINDTVKPDAVECPPPPFACVIEIPQLSDDDVGLVIPGVGNITGSVGVFISDVSIANRSGLLVDDVTLYFAGGAVKLPVDPGRSIGLADISSTVFDKTEAVGALHLRSESALEIALNANVFVKSNPVGTFGTALPVFRTDRGAGGGSAVTITGLRKTATSHTNIYVQELVGTGTTFDITFLDSSGTTIGALSSEQVTAFGTAILGQAFVPEGSLTAIVSNTGQGSIAAFATPVDRASNDTWVVADWAQVFEFEKSEPQQIAVAGSAPGRNDTFFQTDLAVHAASSGSATLRYYQQSPVTLLLEKDIVFNAGETHVYDDVVSSLFEAPAPSLGSIEIEPGAGLDLTVTSRTYTTIKESPATFGTGVPSLPSAKALRFGESIVIGGLEDSTAVTIDAATPATFRTNIGLVEVDGEPVKVSVSLLLFDGTHLAAGGATASRTYELGANQWQQLNAIVGEIVGRELRETDFGELHNVQVRVDVIEGDGAVIVYATTTDNGTGDTVLRIE